MNTNTCGMCGSSVDAANGNGGMVHCGFCKMMVKPSVNGERVESFKRVDLIGYEQIKMSTPELMGMHTKSLLELLRFMREERRNYFDTMRVLKRGASENPMFKDGERMSSDDYEMITRKCFVVENLLRDRMGYIPKKITDNLLIKYNERCSDPYNEKLMNIKKPEIEQKPLNKEAPPIERSLSR